MTGHSGFISKPQWEANRRRFKPDLEAFDDWPRVGEMPDGEPIRTHEWWGHGVQEPSGYVCSPVAYMVRKRLGVTWFAGKGNKDTP